ncbi:MAG: thioredoxin family protein [Chloroflexi bacterium]|nr:thioredoxin family protein [Chloroflexota bacterium]
MVNVKVLGSGCANCQRLEASVRRVVAAQGIEAQVEKVTDYAAMMKYAILATPGLVINEKLMAAGRIPPDKDIAAWLAAAAGQR